MLIVRTVSPYFSPKSAMAPSEMASSRDFSLGMTSISAAHGVVDDLLNSLDLRAASLPQDD